MHGGSELNFTASIFGKVFPLLVSLVFLWAIAFSALVPIVSSQKVIGSQLVTFNPVADSYVREYSPDENYGNYTWLDIRCNAYDEYAYIMFDLSSLPPDAIIIEASLGLGLTDIGGSGDLGVTIGVHYCPDNSWSETGITWSNKPEFAANLTAARGFMGPVLVPSTYWWTITSDVQTAFKLEKMLTEVIKFEQPETSWGYASFRSREQSTKPKLEIEYSTKPFYAVQFDSIQDTGNTSNLGYVNFSSNFLSLPTDALVVNGSYEANYIGGYQFHHWETEGGVGTSDSSAQKTSVTITGPGKLRAVGSADTMQYLFDDSGAEWETYCTTGEMAAVRFTPRFVGTLKKACFFIEDLSSYESNTFKVHVMDADLNDVIAPPAHTPSSTGWFEVDLSIYNISVREDFYVAMEWLTDYYPKLGEDRNSPDRRSLEWNGTRWAVRSYEDYMIRAIVESNQPIRPIGLISCTPYSTYIVGGRNVTVTGSIAPPRVGVEVDVTYIRPDSSTVIRKTTANATSGYTDTFMPDKLGNWKVKASWAGDDEYEGATSYPAEFTVGKGSSYLSCYVDQWSITIGSNATLSGSLIPSRVISINLEHSTDDGASWTVLATLNTNPAGEFSYLWTPRTVGTHKVRATWPGDELCEGDTSYADSLRVMETDETFDVWVDWRWFPVRAKCNSTLSNFAFNQTEKMISFQLTGIPQTIGYCNLTFSKELLGGPYEILVNGSPPSTSSEISNGETTLHFTFEFNSFLDVKIIGTTVIPEFSSMILPLFMIATLLAVIAYRRKHTI